MADAYGAMIIASNAIIRSVDDRAELLRQVMLETGTSQSALARLSGVHQPSISQILSGRIDASDDQLGRLLSCMGYVLEVRRRPVRPTLTRSERRSWALHRQLAEHLTRAALDVWRPTILENLARLRGTVRGEPHLRHLDQWQVLIDADDLAGLRGVLTGLDRSSIEMREVSPLGGLIAPEERQAVLAGAVRCAGIS